ncbi:hypothetical protein FUAX_54340 (plasmid) [Fulvitalea axinellae]|uniref:VWA domain-containing protein n=1 Tax=Fulvitalea axinellae TaxID=1182444 RepID=A0AAU9CZ14_9BACT|nr:hypothetical protein FUAX_54340 [Fulvitalea axinellae]
MEHKKETGQNNERLLLYWRLMSSIFGSEKNPKLEKLSAEILKDAALPEILLSQDHSIDAIVQRYPELQETFDSLTDGIFSDDSKPNLTEENKEPTAEAQATPQMSLETETEIKPAEATETSEAPKQQEESANSGAKEVERAAVYSKMLVNVFAAVQHGTVTAGQYSQWNNDKKWLERAFTRNGEMDGGLQASLKEMEADIVKRMRLREVLADTRLAKKLTPSMALVEELLRDKSHLADVALKNAKDLIKRFIDQVAEVLKTQVAQSKVGKIDYSVPPKKVFRNLDLKRTIWKNLTNWDAKSERLYVENLYYKHTAKKNTPSRLIVVVDQSGSMVDSMVNCTILASIFAGLPKIDPHLIAYDTQAIDLTSWIHDPFEVLMRTQLGGGTDGTAAMEIAKPKVIDPSNTVVVWISDFYEWKAQELFNQFKALHESGVKFIPVGSVSSSNYQSVNPWFKQRFKEMSTPVISGKIDKLIVELKTFLA